jgi:hypothetical protein
MIRDAGFVPSQIGRALGSFDGHNFSFLKGFCSISMEQPYPLLLSPEEFSSGSDEIIPTSNGNTSTALER